MELVVLLVGCFLPFSTPERIASGAVHQSNIIQHVIAQYSTDVRPSLDPKASVNVTLDITFNNIIDVDEKHQILTSSIWVRQTWTNRLTTWNITEYGGLKGIIVDSKKIWQPDTVLYNNVFEEFTGRLDERITRVRLSHSGSTFWAAPFIFKTLCKINVADFPFDTQKCKLTFGSWQYDGTEVDIQNDKKMAAIASSRVENGEWEVTKVLIDRKVLFYQCCPNQPYPEISFVIYMKRRPLFYVVNLVLPNILISLLAFFSFFIPVECGERISFVITVLLSMTVFMLLVAESIPPTSDAVPVIGIYYTFSIIEVFLALLATGISLKINYSYLFGDGLSPKLRKIIFESIGPLLRFDVQNMLERNTADRPSRKAAQFRHNSDEDDVHQKRNTPTNQGTLNGKSLIDENGEKEGGVRIRDATGTELRRLMSRKLYNQRECRVEDDMFSTAKDRKDHFQRATESKLAAAIIDRLFLWVFVVTYFGSTFIILLLPFVRS